MDVKIPHVLPENLYLAFLTIFLLRVVDVSLGTIRTVFILQGRKLLASSIAFVEVSIFIFAISQVVASLSHWSLMFAYSGGFAAGTLLGLVLEERFAMGFVQLRVISHDQGAAISQAIWEAGFGATVVDGYGREGPVQMIFSIIPRRHLQRCTELATKVDSDCFVAISDSRSLLRGHLGLNFRK